MTMARDFSVDRLRQSASPASGVASWYTQGLSDELGDRLLMFDNTGGASLELLRFRPSLSAHPGFEDALRKRTKRLRDFRHPAFATVRGVEWLHPEEGLALVSDHVPGKRLSDVLQHARGVGLAVALIRQLAPALAVLERAGGGIGHGALTPGRIVIGPNGRLTIGEHVVGAALAQLHIDPELLAADFGIVVPPCAGNGDHADSRTDCFQLALIALSVIFGKPVTAHDPDELSRIIDEPLPDGGSRTGRGASWLQVWLRRALQLGGRPFESSADALHAMRVMSDPVDEGALSEATPHTLTAAPTGNPLLAAPPATSADDRTALSREEPREDPAPTADALFASERSSVIDVVARLPLRGDLDRKNTTAASEPLAPSTAGEAVQRGGVSEESKETGNQAKGRGRPWVRGLVAALLIVAVGEAVFIARLMLAPEAAPTASAVESTGATTPAHVPAAVAPEPSDPVASSRAASAGRGAQPPRSTPPVSNAIGTERLAVPPPQPRPATGGIRFEAPIALEVYEGDRRLGSTATGIVPAAAGRRQVDLINSALGFRVRQAVDVRPDRVVSVKVSTPNGLVSINAVPWAQVSIDGKPVGETPLGNLSVPLGEREILFQHPELGSQRQTVVVRLDRTTRVTANLQR